jgi:hypothetical protein
MELAKLDLKDLLDLLVPKGLLDLPDLLDPNQLLDLPVTQDILDHRGPQDLQVFQA